MMIFPFPTKSLELSKYPLTAGEQAFYAEKGFNNEPKRCKPCREKRKQEKKENK